jgi:hypothetical protein
MKIASITQTYQLDNRFSTGSDGKDRSFLIDYLLKDTIQLKLRNLVDLQTFNFHNYNIDQAKDISKKIKNTIPEMKCTVYNNMTLGQSLFSHLDYLKNRGITDILWLQDDEFSIAEERDVIDVFNFYKNNNLINLSLCHSALDIDIENINSETVSENITLYRSSVLDFVEKKKYAMDFSAFICNIEILYNAFKNIDILTKDAYRLEGEFSSFIGSFDFPRCVLNKPLFKTFNVVGMIPSLGCSEQNYDTLQKRFTDS